MNNLEHRNAIDNELINTLNNANIFKSIPQKIKNSNLLLTGGTGFIGKGILDSVILLNQYFNLNISVDVISRAPEHFYKSYPKYRNYQEISMFVGDIRDFRLTDASKYQYVIHGATPVGPSMSDTELYSIIVDGAAHILDVIKDSRANLLFLSSGAVYGTQPSKLSHISEDFKPAPLTAYGRGKLAAERLCLNSDIPTSIARCFAFVGPYLPMDAHYAIGNFIRSAILGEDIIIKGDGRPFRSYMYSADLIRWLWTILLNGENGDIYNVGAEQAIDIKSLAEMTVNIINPKSQITMLKEPAPSVPAPRYVPSTAKAKKRLGLDISIELDEAIKKTWNWYLDAKIIK